jgi:chromosome segregation ATPase
MFAAVEPGVFSRAFSIVFNPVGTVVKNETTILKEKNVQLQQKAVTLEQTNSVLIASQEVVQTKVVALENKLTVVKLSEEQAVKIAESAKASSSKLTEELVSAQVLAKTREQQLQIADERAKEFTSAVEHLTQQAEDTKRKLAAASNDQETMLQEVRRLQNSQRVTIAEYDRVITKLVAANPKSIPALKDDLRTLKSDEVKTSINKAFEKMNKLPTPIGVRVVP